MLLLKRSMFIFILGRLFTLGTDLLYHHVLHIPHRLSHAESLQITVKLGLSHFKRTQRWDVSQFIQYRRHRFIFRPSH